VHWDGACLVHLHSAHGAWLDHGHWGYDFFYGFCICVHT
jgi:hypothetical protein